MVQKLVKEPIPCPDPYADPSGAEVTEARVGGPVKNEMTVIGCHYYSKLHFETSSAATDYLPQRSLERLLSSSDCSSR